MDRDKQLNINLWKDMVGNDDHILTAVSLTASHAFHKMWCHVMQGKLPQV